MKEVAPDMTHAGARLWFLCMILVGTAALWWTYGRSVTPSEEQAGQLGASRSDSASGAPPGSAAERALPADISAARLGSTGMCVGAEALRLDIARKKLYTGFRTDGPHVHYDGRLTEESLVLTAEVLDSAIRKARAFFREPFELPQIYIYRDLAQLEQASCISAGQYVYYDGAVHAVARAGADARVAAALIDGMTHALVHHYLLGRGVSGPAWLHEGMAMLVASETWWHAERWGLRSWALHDHLPFSAMVTLSAHTADPKLSVAALYQSLTMVQAINHLHGELGVRELVDVLAEGLVSETDAFGWAVRGGPEAQEEAWQNAVANQQVMAGFFREWEEPLVIAPAEQLAK